MEVLVGTHRLLSRDVNPHDLGLVIIDEEQRFGVGHKEQMKNLRESHRRAHAFGNADPAHHADVAVGRARYEPHPRRRRAIDGRLRSTWGNGTPTSSPAPIRRELARGGQVYYVTNRVRSIEDAVERVQAAAGEARVGVAHGQMSREDCSSA